MSKTIENPKAVAIETVRHTMRGFAELKPGQYATKYGQHDHEFTFTEPGQDTGLWVLSTNGYEVLVGVEEDGSTEVAVTRGDGKVWKPRLLELLGNAPRPFEDEDGKTWDMAAKSAVSSGVTVAVKLGLGVTEDEDVSAPILDNGASEDLVEDIEDVMLQTSLTAGEVLDALDVGAAILRDNRLWRKPGFDPSNYWETESNVAPGDLELGMEGLEVVRCIYSWERCHQSGARALYGQVVDYLESEYDEDACMSRWERYELHESGQVVLDAFKEVAEYLGVDSSELTTGQVFETIAEMRKAKESGTPT